MIDVLHAQSLQEMIKMLDEKNKIAVISQLQHNIECFAPGHQEETIDLTIRLFDKEPDTIQKNKENAENILNRIRARKREASSINVLNTNDPFNDAMDIIE